MSCVDACAPACPNLQLALPQLDMYIDFHMLDIRLIRVQRDTNKCERVDGNITKHGTYTPTKTESTHESHQHTTDSLHITITITCFCFH